MGRENKKNQRCGNGRDQWSPSGEAAEECRRGLCGKGAEWWAMRLGKRPCRVLGYWKESVQKSNER